MSYHILNINVTENFAAVRIRSFTNKNSIQIVSWSGNRILIFIIHKSAKNEIRCSDIVAADGIICNTVLIQNEVYCLDTDGNLYYLKENTGSKECSWKLVKVMKLDDVVCFHGLRDGFVLVKRIHSNYHSLNCYIFNENKQNIKRFSLELPPLVGNIRCVLTTAKMRHVWNVSTEVILVSVGGVLLMVHAESTNPTLEVLYTSTHEIVTIDYNEEYIIILLVFGIVIFIPWKRKHHWQNVCLPCFASSITLVENTMFCIDGVGLWQCTLKKNETKNITILPECLPIKGVRTLHYIEILQCIIACNEYGDFYLIDLHEKTRIATGKSASYVSVCNKTRTLWDLLNDYCILWRNINLEISCEEDKLNSINLSSVFKISVHTSSTVSTKNNRDYILNINIRNVSKIDFVRTFWKMHVSLRLSSGKTFQNVIIPVNLKKNDCVSVSVPVDVYNFLTPLKLVCSLILDPSIFGSDVHCPLVICPHGVFYIDISYFLIPYSPSTCKQDGKVDRHYAVKFQNRFTLQFLWTFITTNLTQSSNQSLYKLFLTSKAEGIKFIAGSHSVNLSPHADCMSLNIIGRDTKLIHSVKDFFIAWLNQGNTKMISKIFFEKAWVILQDFDDNVNDITYVKLQIEEWRKHITTWLILEC